ncbi:MAG: hypothetical protein FJ303_19940 [Planctomycetes bacterium]|nr:hypothetical protein [Planctomycetota bacterium]
MIKIWLLFQEALTYVEPDPAALAESGVDRDRYLWWHRHFVTMARIFGTLALVLALVWVVLALTLEPEGGRPPPPGAMIFALLLAPPLAFLLGSLYGAVLTILIAPSDFLLGPLGRKWMGLVGTSNIYLAKVVCFIVLAGMTWAVTGMTIGGIVHASRTPDQMPAQK